ncbi:hypothetical protein LV84_03958 [Algoriphagus ratkowskyi]|uniref:Uncharacterized protein n=1 Tax=Algoriphagus ratkowskyi TaxID=57028 RepID=A0A2W7R467_9BACT|nr:hypothetical protein LV84_03958 [Algoriphagus ratkowskyi]
MQWYDYLPCEKSHQNDSGTGIQTLIKQLLTDENHRTLGERYKDAIFL